MDELNGPRREEFVESRRSAGVHERTFLQSTPMGDLVIVTLEGDDPARAFGQMMGATDAFTTWFRDRATRIHGIDPAALPSRFAVRAGRRLPARGRARRLIRRSLFGPHKEPLVSASGSCLRRPAAVLGPISAASGSGRTER